MKECLVEVRLNVTVSELGAIVAVAITSLRKRQHDLISGESIHVFTFYMSTVFDEKCKTFARVKHSCLLAYLFDIL